MPGATIFAPTQTNYRWLKALTNYDELIIQRFVIAPRIEYF